VDVEVISSTPPVPALVNKLLPAQAAHIVEPFNVEWRTGACLDGVQ
jgi:hypothetical protein